MSVSTVDYRCEFSSRKLTELSQNGAAGNLCVGRGKWDVTSELLQDGDEGNEKIDLL